MEVRPESAVHAENAVVQNGGQRKAIEDIDEVLVEGFAEL